MRVQRVIEVRDGLIRQWADDLPDGQSFGNDDKSQWSAWDVAFNWLLARGVRVVGVLGWAGPIDEDRRVLLVIESDETPKIPPFAVQ